MKRILISLATIGLVVGAVVAVTGAWFSDEEVAENNTFTAGTLDLEVGGGAGSLPFVFENVYPNYTNSDLDTLTNVGSIDGSLSIDISAMDNDDNVVTEPEPDDVNEDETEVGELGVLSTMVLWLDVDQDGAFGAGDIELTSDGAVDYDVGANPDLTLEAVDNYDNVSYANVLTLAADGGDVDIFIEYEVPSDTGNAIQSDSVAFDITFTLDQIQP